MDSFIVGKDSVSLEEVRSFLHTREVHHKAFGSSTKNQASGLVVTGGQGQGKSGKTKSNYKIQIIRVLTNDVCNYCKEKYIKKNECHKKKK